MSKTKTYSTSWRERLLFLFAFAGFILTTLQIVEWVKINNSFNLAVTGYQQEFVLPTPYKEKILAEDVSNNIISKLGYESFLDTNYNQFWEFHFTNNGTREIKDLVINLPFNGFYSLDKSGEKIENNFQKKIPLSALRPSESMILQVWGSNYLFSLADKEEIILTSPERKINIDYPVSVSGFGKWLYTLADLFTLPGAFIMILMTCLIFVVIITNKSLEDLFNFVKNFLLKLIGKA